MNPRKFSEILTDLPDAFIESAANPQYGKNSVPSPGQPPESKDAGIRLDPIRLESPQSEPLQKESSGDIPVPRWITAAALAACMLFAVGIGTFMLSGNHDNMQTQSTQDSSDLYEPQAVTGTSAQNSHVTGETQTVILTTPTEQQGTVTAAASSTRQPETATETEQTGTVAATANPQNESTAPPAADDATRADTSAATTTTAAAPQTPVPDILLQNCQTLSDGQPLWADERELSYHDGLDYTVVRVTEGDDLYKRYPNDKPFELTGMYVEIGCAQGAPGETVRVPVYISGVPDLQAAAVFIDPPEGLEPTAITSAVEDDFPDVWGTPSEHSDEYEKYTCFLPVGSFVLSTYESFHPQDGYVLATYSYKIPEDAQSGTVYHVCLNPAKTEFGNGHSQNYQYALYTGVVVVE